MNFFVTGGSRGIGAGIVLEAVRAGHDVAFAYRSNDDAARKIEAEAAAIRPGAKVKGYALDVSRSDRVGEVADAVLEDFDSVEVIVNCAGINRANLVVSMSDEEWHDVLATNLHGPFYVVRAFLPAMLAARFGRIVNISSIQHNGAAGQANYAASKAGLHGFTQALAKEYGRKGITANVVVPGFFDTDMTRETMPQAAKDYWQQYCPMPKGRMGTLAELAATVLFLATGGSFINGQVVPVTGGLDWTY
ncbi:MULTISPECIES: SDR family oxidoreductase [Nannocystis]|uniref:SDR family oxidoreductase n=1 Tax=Nannocystis TaxID=53 RepID=UPI00226FD818|nr:MULTISPECIES: SDR family oxidoreductase [unclassified Nannocystis]MCY0992360.1 SDR family oxidoreductase [Nannocystis sp. ILAH1]MCY1069052.1 SDR family oxidoreductase [Nannocystis sp. RBIL2]